MSLLSSIRDDLRALVFLRRIARALERSASATESIAAISRDRWIREARIRTSKPKMTAIEPMDIEAIRERYRKEQEAAEVGATLED